MPGTMGLNVQRTRTLLFLSTVLLAGTVTAFCGPVGFIGLAVPHLARMLFASADHRILMPGSMLAAPPCCWSATSFRKPWRCRSTPSRP